MVLSKTSKKEYNVDMAIILYHIPTLIVYVLAGKYFIRGLTSGAVKVFSTMKTLKIEELSKNFGSTEVLKKN